MMDEGPNLDILGDYNKRKAIEKQVEEVYNQKQGEVLAVIHKKRMQKRRVITSAIMLTILTVGMTYASLHAINQTKQYAEQNPPYRGEMQNQDEINQAKAKSARDAYNLQTIWGLKTDAINDYGALIDMLTHDKMNEVGTDDKTVTNKLNDEINNYKKFKAYIDKATSDPKSLSDDSRIVIVCELYDEIKKILSAQKEEAMRIGDTQTANSIAEQINSVNTDWENSGLLDHLVIMETQGQEKEQGGMVK
jgi:hypothetical protein